MVPLTVCAIVRVFHKRIGIRVRARVCSNSFFIINTAAAQMDTRLRASVKVLYEMFHLFSYVCRKTARPSYTRARSLPLPKGHSTRCALRVAVDISVSTWHALTLTTVQLNEMLIVCIRNIIVFIIRLRPATRARANVG